MAQSSTLIRYLKNKNLDFCQGRVRQILRWGDERRIVIDDKGNRVVVSKEKLLKAFNSALSADQKKKMARTIVETKNLTATMMLGGTKHGKLKHYKSVKHAKRALDRRYGK